jgi:O-antigen/teichoic acid export membrane protein
MSSPGGTGAPPAPPAETARDARRGVAQTATSEAQGQGMTGTVARGISWVALGKIGGQVLQFASGLVLARLLTPADYGIIASVAVVFGFTMLLFEMGLGAALVHLRDATEADFSTAFWINALGGVVFAVVLTALAPVVAAFFSQPQLLYITPILALTYTFSIGVCHRAKLDRQLKFRGIAMMDMAAAGLGLVTSIILAAAGTGPVALAIGPVVQSAALSIMLWIAVPWRPRRLFRRDSARRLWEFSGGQLGFNVVNYWGRNADNLLVGRFLGAAPLGFYNRAYNLMLLPVQQVSQVLGRVMFPALAAMQDDHLRVANAYRRALRIINVISVPALVGMAATAPGLVPLLWGPAWNDTVPLLQVLSIAGVPQCMGASVGWLYQSQGRTGLMFRAGAAFSALGVVAMVVGLHWGVMGVAVAVLAREWVTLPISLTIAGGLVGLTARRVIADNLLTIGIAAAMGAVVWFLPTVAGLDRDAGWVVGVQVVAGVATYVVLVWLLLPSTFRDIRAMRASRGRRG